MGGLTGADRVRRGVRRRARGRGRVVGAWWAGLPLRAALAGDAVLDGVRSSRIEWWLGESRLFQVAAWLPAWVHVWAGLVLVGAGLMVLMGRWTRCAAAALMPLPAAHLMMQAGRVGGFWTERALTLGAHDVLVLCVGVWVVAGEGGGRRR